MFRILAGALALAQLSSAKENLPSDASLRVGVKFKPADCTRTAKDGDKLSMHYVGTLYKDGSGFDSSRDRGTPFDFQLGRGNVIKGWDIGVQNMCVGEKRKLVIPSGLGYGDSGSPPKIGGGDTLVFEIELMGIE